MIGWIIPSDRVKLVQPLEIGVVKFIHVTEGQRVEAGDPLITLDSTNRNADRQRLFDQLLDTRLRQLRLRSFAAVIETGLLERPAITLAQIEEADFSNSDDALARLAFQQALLDQQIDEFHTRAGALDKDYERQLAAIRTAQSEYAGAQRALPLLDERIVAFEKLLASRYVSRDMYLQLKQSHVELQQDLVTLDSRVQELDSGLASIDQQRQTLTAETRRRALEELEQTTAQAMVLNQELRKADQRSRQQLLVAPIDGTVQQLVANTVGGIVTPAQELMHIVPDEGLLEVEAFILNRDIGFVQEGHSAEVKIDAFNFTQYGVVNAQVVDIANDAVQNETMGLVYPVKVVLLESTIQVDNRRVNLSPGMTVTVCRSEDWEKAFDGVFSFAFDANQAGEC